MKLSSSALIATLSALMLDTGDGKTNSVALRGTSTSFSSSLEGHHQGGGSSDSLLQLQRKLSSSLAENVEVCSNDQDWMRVVLSSVNACDYENGGSETQFEFLQNSTQTQDLEDRLSAIEAQIPGGGQTTSSIVPLCISKKNKRDLDDFGNYGRMKYLPPNTECDEANQEFSAALFADGTMDYRIIQAEVALLGAPPVPGYDDDPDVVHFCPLNDPLWMGIRDTTNVRGCDGPHYRHLLQPVDLVDFEYRVARLELLLGPAPSSSPSSSPTQQLPRSISGYVLADTNLDGEGDSPISNVPMLLLDASGAMVATAKTVSDGSYSFDDLAIGQYTVIETNLVEFPVDVRDADGVNDNKIVVDLNSGLMDSDGNNFVDRLALVSGHVLEDKNYDNDGDVAVTGVTVFLYNADGNKALQTTLTDLSSGRFSFLVEGGVYTLVMKLPDGYDFVRDSDGPTNGNIIKNVDTTTGDSSDHYFILRAHGLPAGGFP